MIIFDKDRHRKLNPIPWWIVVPVFVVVLICDLIAVLK